MADNNNDNGSNDSETNDEIQKLISELPEEEVRRLLSESDYRRRSAYEEAGVTAVSDSLRDFDEALNALLAELKESEDNEFSGSYDDETTEAMYLFIEGIAGRTGRVTRQTICKVFLAAMEEVDEVVS